jgi:quinol monooxygenase YgiN
MKSLYRLMAAATIAVVSIVAGVTSAVAQTAPPPPPAGPAYTVIYIEAAPGTGAQVTKLLRDVRAAARKAEGNWRHEILQRRERPNHFAILEIWKDAAAYQANLTADHTRKFRDGLKPLLIAAYDERPHTGMDIGEISAGAGAKGNAVYVVTHVDFIPPRKDEGIAGLKELAAPSRKDGGSLRYEVQQQNSRPNHLTLVEIWKDHNALEAHEKTAHVVKFRDALLPMSGSLFDQRLYRAIE